jgi:hypothetical protein
MALMYLSPNIHFISLVLKMVNICVEGHELFGFLKSRSVLFLGPCRGCDILVFKGSKALPFEKFSDRWYEGALAEDCKSSVPKYSAFRFLEYFSE